MHCQPSVKVPLEATVIQDENPRILQKKLVPKSRAVGVLGDITNISREGDLAKKKLNVSLTTVSGPTVEEVEDQVAENEEEEIRAHLGDKLENIDDYDQFDPQSVVPYIESVYSASRIKEARYYPITNYMDNQPHINEEMRAILIDWLIDVHLKFKLLPETMHLSVYLIDKFLSTNGIARLKFQLVGITAMFTASKYEEIYPPECDDFVLISASAYSREEVFAMERVILNAMGFKLTVPTSLFFLRRFSKAAHNSYRLHTLCKYLVELALVDMRMIKYLPSKIAAAAIYLSRIMIFKEPLWNATLRHYTQYSPSDVFPCVRDLHAVLKISYSSDEGGDGVLNAAYRKYSSPKFSRVSTIPPPESVI